MLNERIPTYWDGLVAVILHKNDDKKNYRSIRLSHVYRQITRTNLTNRITKNSIAISLRNKVSKQNLSQTPSLQVMKVIIKTSIESNKPFNLTLVD